MATSLKSFLEDDGMDWQEKLKRYATDRNAGQAEYTRANNVYNYKNSVGDKDGAASAQKWMGQVDTSMGGVMSKPTSAVDWGMDEYKSYMDKTMNRTPFNAASDQQYQYQLAAAKSAAQQGAQTATNNAMVSLGSRGIGNSSVAVDRANQIGQQANTNLQLNLEPQIMQQAYQRWMDQQNQDQTNLKNLGGYVDMMNTLQQQGFNNNITEAGLTGKYNGQNTLDQRIANVNTARQLGQDTGTVLRPTDDWGDPLINQIDGAPLNIQGQQVEYQKTRDLIADQQYKQKFDEDVRQSGLDYALRQAQLANQISAQQADDARQAAALQLQQDKFEYDKSKDGISTPGAMKPSEMSSYITQLDKRYVDDKGSVKDAYAMRSAIINLDLSDDDTIKLLNYYQLPVQNPTYSGGR